MNIGILSMQRVRYEVGSMGYSNFADV